MQKLEIVLLALLAVGLTLGGWGILGGRARHGGPAWLGRWLCISAIVTLGCSSWLAAFHRAEALAPLGLAAGLLLVGMCWDGTALHDSKSFAPVTDE